MNCQTCSAPVEAGAIACSNCGSLLDSQDTAPAHHLPPGTPLHGGDFTIRGTLSAGGFGITYQADDNRLQRLVAIKEFFPPFCARIERSVQPGSHLQPQYYEEARAGFLHEATTLARFRHPGLAVVFSVFEENNTAYMVMEFLQGHNLLQLLQQHGGRLAENDAVEIIRQVAAALSHVHETGLLHRDVRPDNILLTGRDRVVLINFGTASEFEIERAGHQSLIVTPGYAPLEQHAPRARRGPFSDIYSLAATLYHLVTGQPPAPATDRAAGGSLVPPRQLNSSLSPGLEQVVVKALELGVENRTQTVAEFLRMLDERLPVAPPVKLPFPHSPTVTKRPQVSRWIAAVGVPVAVAFGFWLLKANEARDKRVAAEMMQPLITPRTSPHRKPTPPPALSKPLSATLLADFQSLATAHFAGDGRRLMGFSRDGKVFLWDVADGRSVLKFSPGTNTPYFATLSDDGKLLAIGDATRQGDYMWARGVYKLISKSPQRPIQVRKIDSNEIVASLNRDQPANDVIFTPDSRLLIQLVGGGSLAVWQLSSGKLLFTLPAPPGLQSFASVLSLDISPDSRLLACSYSDRSVRLWDLQSGKAVGPVMMRPSPVQQVTFSPDGQQVLCNQYSDSWFWNWKSNTSTNLPRESPVSRFHGAVYSPNGQRIAVMGSSSSSGTGSSEQRVAAILNSKGQFIKLCGLESDNVVSVRFSRDSKTLLGVGTEGAIARWKVP